MDIDAIERMSRDLAKAARTMGASEARILVDMYYTWQEYRKGLANQVLALSTSGEPHGVLAYMLTNAEIMESQAKRALDQYTQSHPMGEWMRKIYGIGPVLSAGLLAHIDIEKAKTAGQIWRFAGLDPTSVWGKGEKRPWNGALKTLCWKVGQSFMKFSNHPDCFYGHIYRERKAFEIERNEAGKNRDVALIAAERVGKTTDAHAWYSQGKLPPAHIDARARRYAVKLFISHLHGAWYERHYGKPPPAPYPIAILGHAHMIEAQH